MIQMATFLLAVGLLAPPSPSPTPTPKATSKPSSQAQQAAGSGPLDFRCDNMRVESKPNRTICRGNVVLRRGDMLVCCRLFDGQADEKWNWQRFVCSHDVRAQRGMETVWAQKADFAFNSSELVLTGKPVIQRGQSILDGDKVIVYTNQDQAHVEKPRGHVANGQPIAETEVVSLLGPLPSVCPLPPLSKVQSP